MYESFYGLKEKPFDLHPDPDYLYMSQGHGNAYTHLEYAITENKGFVVVTGEIGSGKTTLINYLLTKIGQDMEVGLISNTGLPSEQFLMMICREFEVPINGAAADKSEMIDRFHDFLLDQFAKKKRVILIIDEAQNLSVEALEEIRMLSNLEAEKHHLIQMILVGQPELKAKLQDRNLAQFAQRVTVHCHLQGLKRREVEKYVRYRLKVAGAREANIFSDDAIASVFVNSKGIPRLINILCDTALVYGYADGVKYLDKDIIEAVVKSRKAGGLFTDGLESEKTERTARRRNFENKDFRNLEKRMDMLETLAMNLSKKVDLLSAQKEKRDQLVLDLFKMLKSNMESRIKMAGDYLSLHKKSQAIQRESFKDEQTENDASPSPRPIFTPRLAIWFAIALAVVGAALTLPNFLHSIM